LRLIHHCAGETGEADRGLAMVAGLTFGLSLLNVPGQQVPREKFGVKTKRKGIVAVARKGQSKLPRFR
jgi:hypothetical protein